MKSVAFTSAARRQLRKLLKKVQANIIEAIEAYAETGEGDVKKLVNLEGCRLRIGDYRALFTETEEEIEVRAVGHRKDIYR